MFRKLITAVIKPLKTAVNFLLESIKPDEDKALIYDFNSCRDLIISRNKEETIKKLMNVVRKGVLQTQGLLISDVQAHREALILFKEMKEMGAIDCINKLKRANG